MLGHTPLELASELEGWKTYPVSTQVVVFGCVSCIVVMVVVVLMVALVRIFPTVVALVLVKVAGVVVVVEHFLAKDLLPTKGLVVLGH